MEQGLGCTWLLDTGCGIPCWVPGASRDLIAFLEG